MADLTFATMTTELQARGFDYLSATRAGYFLNRSYWEICEEANWPFLGASTTGTAPLTIATLRTVESVIDTTARVKLRPLDVRAITDENVDLTTTGTPLYYYVRNSIISVFPANTTDTLSVRYWQAPAELTGTDASLIPARFRQLIVDGAVAYAYMDTDDFDAANETFSIWEAGKERMRQSLLIQQADRPEQTIVDVTSGSGF